MDQCTHEMRGNRWLQIIQACERRPTYQSKTEWLRENGVPESSYYNQLRRLRSELSTQIKQSLPLEQKPAETSFVELPPDMLHSTSVSNVEGDSIQLKIGSSEIIISDSISDEFLTRILKAVRYVG